MIMRKPTIVLASLLVLVVLVAAAGAQQTPPAGPGDTAPPAGKEAVQAPFSGEDEVDVSRIDQILRGEEKVFEGEKFTYDPAGRRDPFISLAEGIQEEERAEERPDGLPGMLIEELRLEGIIQTSSGIIAFVQGRDKLSYILRPGTKLYNGEVAAIEPRRVIFKQQVNDPKALKPFREVVREIAE